MKLFLSWSGNRSKSVAIALREWLPLILYYVEPWISERDIAAGNRWALEVGKGLEESTYGIICLTRENLQAPWVLFEAGALSKELATGAVCPYLLDVEFSDIMGPLSQFQAKKAERTQTLEMVEALNSLADAPIDVVKLSHLFEALWPQFEQRLHSIPLEPNTTTAIRTQPEILEDLVELIRGVDNRLRGLEESRMNTSEMADQFRSLENALTKVRDNGISYKQLDELEGMVLRLDYRLRNLEGILAQKRYVSGRGKTGDIGVPNDNSKVRILAKHTVGKLRGGQQITCDATTNLLDDLALLLGVSVDGFGSEWNLYDPAKKRMLNNNNCSNLREYFGDKEYLLILTNPKQ